MPPFYVEPKDNGGGGGGGAGTSLSVALRSEASLLPNSDFPAGQHTIVWVDEVEGNYLFVRGSVAAIDGWRVLTHPNGRLILQQSEISISPLNTGADDWPRVVSAMNACAYNVKIILRDGEWLAKTAGIVPSGTDLQMGPGVRITSTIVNIGFMSSIFAADGIPIDNGTLTATPVLYSNSCQITIPTKPLVNQFLEIYHATSTSIYTIKAISAGVAPWTVTLDRPIVFPWVNGDNVSSLSYIPQDIRIDGKGAKLSGTGNQTLEFARARNVQLFDMEMDGLHGRPDGAVYGFDVGGNENFAYRLKADMTGIINAVTFYMQSNERSIVRDCRAMGGDSGIVIYDSYSCGMEDCWAYNSSRGLQLITLADGANASLGNFDCWVNDGGAVNCPIGVNVYGSRNSAVNAVSVRGASINGFQLEIGALGEITDVTDITNCNAIGCAIGMTVTSALVTNTKVSKFDSSASAQGIVWTGIATVDGWTHAHGTQITQLATFNGSLVKLSNLNISSAGVIGSGALMQFGGANTKTFIDKSTIIAETTSTLTLYLSGAGGIIKVDNCLITGNRGIDSNNNCTTVIGYNNNFSGCVTPYPTYNPAGPKYVNTGDIALTTGVATFPWPLTRADDSPPVINRKNTSQGLTGTGGWLVTKNAGVGVVITAINIDGSTAATDEGTFNVYIPH